MLAKICIAIIQVYQMVLSPILGNNCRFSPTCSHYGKTAFERHGFIKGFLLTTNRILRCNPWGGSGYDPVPPKK